MNRAGLVFLWSLGFCLSIATIVSCILILVATMG